MLWYLKVTTPHSSAFFTFHHPPSPLWRCITFSPETVPSNDYELIHSRFNKKTSSVSFLGGYIHRVGVFNEDYDFSEVGSTFHLRVTLGGQIHTLFDPTVKLVTNFDQCLRWRTHRVGRSTELKTVCTYIVFTPPSGIVQLRKGVLEGPWQVKMTLLRDDFGTFPVMSYTSAVLSWPMVERYVSSLTWGTVLLVLPCITEHIQACCR